MKSLTIARRYAKALYQLSLERKNTEDVLQGMSNISSALKTTSLLGRVLFNPLVRVEEKQTLIKTISSNKLLLKFTALLARRKRLDLLPVINDELAAFRDGAVGIRRFLIKTAVPLTEAQKRAVEKNLAKTFGGKIIGRYAVARDLIGGVWLKIEDKVLDLTMKGRFEDLRHTLVHSTN